MFKNSKIVSIEPTIYAYSKLKKNVSLNPSLKSRIKLENSFISNKNKSVKEVHSSWNFSDNNKKHKVHLGILKKHLLKPRNLIKFVQNLRKSILLRLM